MDQSSESEISDSEIDAYEEKIYRRFEAGRYKVRKTDNTCRCPFYVGEKKMGVRLQRRVASACNRVRCIQKERKSEGEASCHGKIF